MSEEGQLIPLKDLGIATADQLGGAMETLTKTSDFLPQMRVYGSEAAVVKEGKFPLGHLGLYFAANNIVDLGTQIDCLVIAARPRASIVTGDQPISYYKFDSPEFQDTLTRAKLKQRDTGYKPGYLAGLEYLLWLPSVGKYTLFLMGNTTLRRESTNLKALLGKGATIQMKYIKTTQHSWHGVQVFPCTTPMQLPDIESLQDEVAKFNNPKESQVELADDTQGSDRVR
jgi:hypothetical protein